MFRRPLLKDKTTKLRINKSNRLNKKKFLSLSIYVLLILTVVGLYRSGFITNTLVNFLDNIGIYTREIPSIEIESNDYNNPGSWHINKSAKWTGVGKAQVTFDVESVQKIPDSNKDIIIVLDISGSMYGDKLQRAKEDAKALTEVVLSDSNNRMALITFGSSSEITSNFTNNKEEMLSKINGLSDRGATNYNAGLKNVFEVLENYQRQNNRDLITLFLTDGYPNGDVPNQI